MPSGPLGLAFAQMGVFTIDRRPDEVGNSIKTVNSRNAIEAINQSKKFFNVARTYSLRCAKTPAIDISKHGYLHRGAGCLMGMIPRLTMGLKKEKV